jgi:hypothetical protein
MVFGCYHEHMAPTIFRAHGFRFFFFSREESRLHVHVNHAEGEAKFWMEPQIALAQNIGLSGKALKQAQALLRSMNMTYAKLGSNTSEAEITNVSKQGFWLLLGEEELFVAFKDFPWFAEAPIGKLTHVELPQPHHLYWPELDVDLAVESIRNPAAFPLVARS